MGRNQTSLMRSLGRFVGHIAAGVANPGSRRTTVSSRTEEREVTTPAGETLVLRRTVIEEVELRPQPRGGEHGGGPEQR